MPLILTFSAHMRLTQKQTIIGLFISLNLMYLFIAVMMIINRFRTLAISFMYYSERSKLWDVIIAHLFAGILIAISSIGLGSVFSKVYLKYKISTAMNAYICLVLIFTIYQLGKECVYIVWAKHLVYSNVKIELEDDNGKRFLEDQDSRTLLISVLLGFFSVLSASFLQRDESSVVVSSDDDEEADKDHDNLRPSSLFEKAPAINFDFVVNTLFHLFNTSFFVLGMFILLDLSSSERGILIIISRAPRLWYFSFDSIN